MLIDWMMKWNPVGLFLNERASISQSLHFEDWTANYTLFHRSDEKLNQSLNEMLQAYILSDTESCQARYLIYLMISKEWKKSRDLNFFFGFEGNSSSLEDMFMLINISFCRNIANVEHL